MTKEELANVVCPWAIIIASICFNSNKITGKELKMEPSKLNEIGAKTKLTPLD